MAFGRDYMNHPFFRDSGVPPMMMQPDPFLFGRQAPNTNQQSLSLHPQHPFALSPFGGALFPSMFGGHDPFSAMQRMMAQHASIAAAGGGGGGGGRESNGASHSFSSSSVMHYSSMGGGAQPRVYHATSSTRQAPGGIKETRRSVKDSESGLQKISIGHQIGERSHTIERRFNAHTREKEEHQELVNLDEDEAGVFDSEWKEKTSRVMAVGPGRRHHLADTRGLTAPQPRHTSTTTTTNAVNGKRRSRPSSLSKEQLEDSELFVAGEHRPHPRHQSTTAGPSTYHHPQLLHPQSKHPSSSTSQARPKNPTSKAHRSHVLVVDDDDDQSDEEPKILPPAADYQHIATGYASQDSSSLGRGGGGGRGGNRPRHSDGSKRHTNKQKKVHF